METNGVWDDYPVQWDEKKFVFRSEADKYALLKAKEWLSKNSNIKLKRIFTEEEWVIHKICIVFLWMIFSVIGIVVLLSLISQYL